jgi:hypothetical protein
VRVPARQFRSAHPPRTAAPDQTYREVFGAEGDTASLRDLLVAGTAPSPVMPSAQAALIALRGLRTDIADAVLERARHYYTARA